MALLSPPCRPAARHLSSRQASRSRVVAAVATKPPGANASSGPPQEIVRISPELLAAGGLDPSRESPANLAAFGEMLAKGFLPVNLSTAGIRVLNIDPPVLTVDGFLPPEACDALVAAAAASGSLAPSGVGGSGGLGPDVRTSSTLAITRDVLAAATGLRPPLQQLLDTAVALVGGGLDTSAISAMQFAQPKAGGGDAGQQQPQQLYPELPQVAHYQPGQHFLAHEDGFPGDVALAKGYQRRATLLVYLNDVPEGGATKFEHLQFGVQPQKGKALLFFPAFSGGRPDARTLHTAEDAITEKWVFQLWLCSSLPKRPPVDAAAHAAQQLAAARKAGSSRSPKGKRPNRKNTGSSTR